MSGGSLNYLCYKDVADLFGAIEELEKVETAMQRRGAVDIAKDVRRLIEYILTAENRISVLAENLHGVFKALEWRTSGDWDEDELIEEIEAYRTKGAKP